MAEHTEFLGNTRNQNYQAAVREVYKGMLGPYASVFINNENMTFREQRKLSKKYWTKYAAPIKDRANDYPDPATVAAAARLAADRAYQRAESLSAKATLAALAGLDDVVDYIAGLLYIEMWELYTDYCETLIDTWGHAEGSFNHGQIVITEMHYWMEILMHCQDAAHDWPDVDPEEYLDHVFFAYNPDVFMRAFTDVAEEPIPSMEALVDAAKTVKTYYQVVAGVSTYVDLFGGLDGLPSMHEPHGAIQIEGANGKYINANPEVYAHGPEHIIDGDTGHYDGDLESDFPMEDLEDLDF